MRKIIAFALALVMMTALPVGVLAQEDSAGQSEDMLIEPWYYAPVPSGFEYSENFANGTYVDFGVNEETGVISDYTVTMVDYNYYYPLCYGAAGERVDGDNATEPTEPTVTVVKFFDSVKVNGFVPNGHPATFGSSFYFMGDDVLMTFYDSSYSSATYQFGEENYSVTLKVADGFTISETPYYWELYAPPDSQPGDWKDVEQGNMPDEAGGANGNGEMITGEDTGIPYAPYLQTWDEVWIEQGNSICSISVSPGDIVVDNATGTLTINTCANAYLSFSTWIEMSYSNSYPEPWTEDMNTEDRDFVETAIENGLLAATGYLFSGEGGTQYTDSDTYNDPSFQFEFREVNRNRITVEVCSEIEQGRIVSLNINKDALNASSPNDLKVLLDGTDIKRCDSIEELTEMQGGTEGGYYVVFGQTQNTVFVYVPHFSTHTINIQSVAGLLPNLLVPGLLATVLIVGAVVLALMRGKKKSDDF